MKLKYYLRGLGAGIIVTAILMGVAASQHSKPMSDAEVIARAEELGMVKSTVLSNDLETEPSVSDNTADAANDAKTDEVADATNQDTQEALDKVEKAEADAKAKEDELNQKQDELADTDDNSDTKADSKTDTKSDAKTDSKTDATTDDSSKTDTSTANSGSAQVVTINSGDGSYTVATKLQQLGVITDAKAFDTYLCTNGYDKRLTTGKHDIPANATNQQIAEALVKKGY